MSAAEEQFALLHDPDFVAWAEDVRVRVMPMIAESAMTVSLVPLGPADVKFAVELGLSIMLDKPLVMVIAPGQEMPPKLRVVADYIVEWEPGGSHADLMAAINAVMEK